MLHLAWHRACRASITLHEVCGFVERVMSESDVSQNQAESTSPILDIKQHETAVAAARSSAESLLAAIQGDAQSVTATKEAVEQAKSQIEGHVGAAKESLTALAGQIDTARNSSSELEAIASKIQTANLQSAESAKQASAAIEGAKQLSSSASGLIGQLETIRDEAVKAQATIKERNAWIENGLKHVQKVQAELDAELDKATRSAEAAEREHQSSKSLSTEISSLQLKAKATKEKADSDASALAATLTEAETDAAATKKLADIAEATEKKIAEYESQLQLLIKQCEQQQRQIHELLGGATDAGLASAFAERSKKFKRPELIWQIAFVAALLGLVGVAVWQHRSYQSMIQAASAAGIAAQQAPLLPDWQELLRLLAIKLPFAAPLIWLAIHSARQAALAKQMEEEYAYKATISMSFDGYRRQMADVAKDLAPDSPLGSLCNNTLREIASSPGRVYSGQRIDPNIASSVAEILKPAVETKLQSIAEKLPVISTK